MGTFFTELMSEARAEKKITLRKLGEYMEVAPSLLSEIENRIRPVPKSDEFITRLANILGIDVEEALIGAKRERIATNPKRIRNLFKNQELAACYYRLDERNVSDQELLDAILKAMRELEEKK